ncbi:MAG: hypothetical protein ACR2I5_12320 [Candidatus Limnocylindria bacterium]
MNAWLRELSRIAAVAQLAIPHNKAGRELNPDRPRDATLTVARAPHLEKRDATVHRPPRRAPTPRDAA